MTFLRLLEWNVCIFDGDMLAATAKLGLTGLQRWAIFAGGSGNAKRLRQGHTRRSLHHASIRCGNSYDRAPGEAEPSCPLPEPEMLNYTLDVAQGLAFLWLGMAFSPVSEGLEQVTGFIDALPGLMLMCACCCLVLCILKGMERKERP